MFYARIKSIDLKINQPRIWLSPIARPYGGALQIAALLDCGGSTPSGSRDTAPIDSRYETHLDTPPSDTEERSTLSCPVFEGTH